MSTGPFGRFASAALLFLAAGGPAAAMEQPDERFEVTLESLPAPYATQSVANSVNTVARPEGFAPLLPAGFRATLFADDLAHPRNLVVDPANRVYLAQSRAGEITLLQDLDGDGRAERRETAADGLSRPHGLALADGYLHIADLDAIWRAPVLADGRLGALERLTEPGALGPGSGHWTRNIAISPDGRALFAAIGSRGNIAEEPAPRAAVKRWDRAADGSLSNPRLYATGLRNPVGTAFHPATGALYTVVNERDGMGDGLVPDFLAEVRDGAFYGWPYAYADGRPQPGFADRRPDLVAATVTPDLMFESHSAPIGLAFLAGADAPEEWRDDALVALRGSWNAAVPTGYKVVRVPFENGRPLGHYVNFATGFRLDDPRAEPTGPADVWGRPTGVAVGPDGAIFISDDTGRTLWRIERTR